NDKSGSFIPEFGDGLRVGGNGSGTMTFADGTVLHLEPGTEIIFQSVANPPRNGGKQLKLISGSLSADVAKQPMDLPLLIQTPHALVTVVGTQFDLAVSTNQTELEVTRGLVKMADTGAAKTVSVAEGEFAVASPNAAMQYGRLARNPFLWPFSSASIWNQPLGSGAKYEAVSRPFLAEGPLENAVQSRRPFLGHADDPLRKIWVNGQLRGDARLDEKQIPKNTSRDSAVLMQRARRYALEVRNIELRPDGGLDATDTERTDLAGSGVNDHAIPAIPFGLSNLGGLIRFGEYEQGIRHALSARVNRERLSGRRNFNSPGTIWPATGGDEPVEGFLNIGTLLAIPPEVDIRKFVGETGAGFELARAMQDYGVYITGFGKEPFTLIVGEARLDREKEDALLNQLIPLLKVVVNNTVETPGGGGTPRKPLAPALPVVSQ
ncbi:MAG: FecR family protein, partial [Verrucomicrobiota bacterium]